jgi:hypothetical protein
MRFLPAQPPLAGALGEEVLHLEAVHSRKFLRPLPDDQHVVGAFHHRARDLRGMHDALQRGDGPGSVCGPVHQRAAELHVALGVGNASVADGDILGVRLHQSHAFEDAVERPAAALHDLHGAPRGLHPVAAGDGDGAVGQGFERGGAPQRMA